MNEKKIKISQTGHKSSMKWKDFENSHSTSAYIKSNWFAERRWNINQKWKHTVLHTNTHMHTHSTVIHTSSNESAVFFIYWVAHVLRAWARVDKKKEPTYVYTKTHLLNATSPEYEQSSHIEWAVTSMQICCCVFCLFCCCNYYYCRRRRHFESI